MVIFYHIEKRTSSSGMKSPTRVSGAISYEYLLGSCQSPKQLRLSTQRGSFWLYFCHFPVGSGLFCTWQSPLTLVMKVKCLLWPFPLPSSVISPLQAEAWLQSSMVQVLILAQQHTSSETLIFCFVLFFDIKFIGHLFHDFKVYVSVVFRMPIIS